MGLVGSEPPAPIDRPQVPLAKRPDFDLGSTRVFPSRLLLEGPSATVPLERRVMEVLLTFVDAHGAVLSRDELLERCWPGVVVGDDAVHRVIGGLRKAAAAAGGAFVIETIPRIGYRLKPSEPEPALRSAAEGGPLARTRYRQHRTARVSRRGCWRGAALSAVGSLGGIQHADSQPGVTRLVERHGSRPTRNTSREPRSHS
jgi:DNA-binding winged helix-turn-helix (wHTH) protein